MRHLILLTPKIFIAAMPVSVADSTAQRNSLLVIRDWHAGHPGLACWSSAKARTQCSHGGEHCCVIAPQLRIRLFTKSCRIWILFDIVYCRARLTSRLTEGLNPTSWSAPLCFLEKTTFLLVDTCYLLKPLRV